MSDDFRYLDKYERQVVWQWFWGIVGFLVVASLVGLVLHWLLLPTKILNPDEGLARWRWFYDAKTQLDAKAGNIRITERAVTDFETLHGSPNHWSFEEQNEHSRLLTVRDASIRSYNNLVAEYNSKMDDITRNWSAPPDLPRHYNNWGE